MDITDSSTWIIFGLALLIGLSIAMIAWMISRFAAAVPTQDRAYFEDPPKGFKMFWWPIQWFAFYLDPLISAKNHEDTMAKLRAAGLDYSLNPSQFMAARLVYGAIAAAFAWFVCDTFGLDTLLPMLCMFLFGMVLPAIWLGDKIKARRLQTLQTLPFMLDIITLCVESGLNINSAFQQAVDKGPAGALKEEFQRVLRDIRIGKPRAESLREMKVRMNSPAMSSFVTTLIQAENSGMSLGKIMRGQAEQRRVERFARAEKLAMEAPIKMLFPLLMFIFPIIFIIIAFLIYTKFTLDTAGAV